MFSYVSKITVQLLSAVTMSARENNGKANYMCRVDGAIPYL